MLLITISANKLRSDKVCYRLFEKRGLLHAQSFGATHLGALMFVKQHAPTGRAATAQGYLAIAAGLAMAAATGISGVLYADFGSRAYIAMALVAAAGGACGFVAQRIRRVPTC